MKDIYFEPQSGRFTQTMCFANSLDFSTTNVKCNLRCSFCPNSLPKFYERELVLANDAIINHLLWELNAMKFSGIIRFGIQSEPFLDTRFLNIVNLIRIRVPRAKVTCETNGTLIDSDDVVSFFKRGGELFRINVYDEERMQHFLDLSSDVQNSISGLEVNDSSERASYIHISTGDKILQIEDNFSENAFDNLIKKRINRGGSIDIGEDASKFLNKRCVKPFRIMMVNHLGDVVLCCNDWSHEVRFGNIMRHKLVDIWNSKKMFNFRWHLYEKHRALLPVCKKCNYYGGTHQYTLYVPIKYEDESELRGYKKWNKQKVT